MVLFEQAESEEEFDPSAVIDIAKFKAANAPSKQVSHGFLTTFHGFLFFKSKYPSGAIFVGIAKRDYVGKIAQFASRMF